MEMLTGFDLSGARGIMTGIRKVDGIIVSRFGWQRLSRKVGLEEIRAAEISKAHR